MGINQSEGSYARYFDSIPSAMKPTTKEPKVVQ